MSLGQLLIPSLRAACTPSGRFPGSGGAHGGLLQARPRPPWSPCGHSLEQDGWHVLDRPTGYPWLQGLGHPAF